VLRQVLLPLLIPQSAAIRRLEEILAEEDEAGLARSKVEWLERFHNAVRDDGPYIFLRPGYSPKKS
jgi:hypothetical protein